MHRAQESARGCTPALSIGTCFAFYTSDVNLLLVSKVSAVWLENASIASSRVAISWRTWTGVVTQGHPRYSHHPAQHNHCAHHCSLHKALFVFKVQGTFCFLKLSRANVCKGGDALSECCASSGVPAAAQTWQHAPPAAPAPSRAAQEPGLCARTHSRTCPSRNEMAGGPFLYRIRDENFTQNQHLLLTVLREKYISFKKKIKKILAPF